MTAVRLISVFPVKVGLDKALRATGVSLLESNAKGPPVQIDLLVLQR